MKRFWNTPIFGSALDHLHDALRSRFPFYAAWDGHPYSSHTHWVLFGAFFVGWLTVITALFVPSERLLAVTGQNLTQAHYRWRNDDGNESAATFAAAEDTSATLAKYVPIRLRLGISNEGTATADPASFRLQYAPKGSGACAQVAEGSWVTVPTSATNEHFQLADSANLTHGDPTTNIANGLTDSAGKTFLAGVTQDTANDTSPLALTNSQFTELEYGVKATGNATDNGTYCMRTVNAGPSVRTGALTLASEENLLTSAVIDSANTFAYFGTSTYPGRVIKVRLSDFTRVGALPLQTEENFLTSAVIDSTNTFAYFGTSTYPGRVIKVRLSDFTRVGAITLESGEDRLTSAVIDSTNTFAYFGTNTYPGRVIKIRLSDFTRVGALPLQTEENLLTSAVIDSTNTFAYFGTNTYPGRVIKVRLSDFTRVGALTLESGENWLPSAVIDSRNGFAYFGAVGVPGTVVKIRLSDFTRVGALTLESGENWLTSAVIDSTNTFAYFGTGNFPGRVIKVRLSDFTRVEGLTLESGEDSLRSAVIDSANGFAYFGTFTPPGKVVKIRLSDFMRVGALTSLLDTYTTYAEVTATPIETGTVVALPQSGATLQYPSLCTSQCGAAQDGCGTTCLIVKAGEVCSAAGGPAIFETVAWSATTPAGTTVKLQLASNNDNATWNFVGPDGTADSFYTVADGSPISSVHTGDRYLRYRAILITTDPAATPALRAVTITYTPIATPGFAAEEEVVALAPPSFFTPPPPSTTTPALIPSDAEPVLKNFVHLAGTYDGKEMRAYVNGVLEATLPASGLLLTSGEPFVIGNYSQGEGANDFAGRVDAVAVYNRALSPSEVVALRDGDNPATGLVSLWPGNGNAQDREGRNPGTLVNGTTFAEGKYNQAFAFDGIDDRVSVPDSNSLDFTSGVTLAAWVRVDAITQQFPVIAGKTPPQAFIASGYAPYLLGIANGGFYFRITLVGGVNYDVTSVTTLGGQPPTSVIKETTITTTIPAAPTITVITTTSSGTVVTGTAPAGSTLVVTIDGVQLTAVADASGTWSLALDPNRFAAGTYAIILQWETDTTASAPVSQKLALAPPSSPVAPPLQQTTISFILTSPPILADNSPVLSGTVPASGKTIGVVINEQPVTTTTVDDAGMFSFPLPIRLPDGTHTLVLIVDGVPTAPLSFTIDTVPPPSASDVTVTIIRQDPSASADRVDATVLVTGTVPASVAVVTITDTETGNVLARVVPENGVFTAMIPLPGQKPGVAEFTVTTEDAAGNTAVASAPTPYEITTATIRYACSDGIDNDGDGTIDYPADPGCTGFTDPDESDPLLTTIAQQPVVQAVATAVTDITNTIITTTKEVTKEVVKQTVFAAEAAEEIVEKTKELAPPILAVTVPVAIIANPAVVGHLPAIPGLVGHTLSWFFVGLGIRKKRKNPWGTVYDAVTKQPLGLAIVRLLDATTKQLIATQVTDNEGRFEFLMKPGAYTLRVVKTPYTFPSTLITEPIDGEFFDVYHGKMITIKDKQENIHISIPLDPKDPRKRSHAVFRNFLESAHRVAAKASLPLLVVGTAWSIVFYAFSRTQYNLLILLAYVAFAAFQTILIPKKPRSFGTVFDAANLAPVPLAIVHVIDPVGKRVVKSRLSDYYGRFTFLPPPGAYELSVVKEGYVFPAKHPPTTQHTYRRIYTGGPIVVPKEKAIIAVDLPLDLGRRALHKTAFGRRVTTPLPESVPLRGMVRRTTKTRKKMPEKPPRRARKNPINT